MGRRHCRPSHRRGGNPFTHADWLSGRSARGRDGRAQGGPGCRQFPPGPETAPVRASRLPSNIIAAYTGMRRLDSPGASPTPLNCPPLPSIPPPSLNPSPSTLPSPLPYPFRLHPPWRAVSMNRKRKFEAWKTKEFVCGEENGYVGGWLVFE